MDRMERSERTPRRCRRWYPVVIAVLLVALLAESVVLALLWWDRHRNPEVGDLRRGQVYVNDGISGVWITPAEGKPAAGLAPEDFTVGDNQPVYSGGDYTTSYGIDVSEWQGYIDWSAVRKSGVDFAVIRLGYRSSGSGKIGEDERARENLQNARAAGVQVGVYFFSQAISAEEAREEAAFVLALLDGCPLELPVLLDWEHVSSADARTAEIGYDQLNECVAAFCEAIEESGYEAGIYANRQMGYYKLDMSALADYDLWVADFNSSPDFYYRFLLWQYSDSNVCPGITGAVDRNMMFVPIA